jgi:hypothetical protein
VAGVFLFLGRHFAYSRALSELEGLFHVPDGISGARLHVGQRAGVCQGPCSEPPVLRLSSPRSRRERRLRPSHPGRGGRRLPVAAWPRRLGLEMSSDGPARTTNKDGSRPRTGGLGRSASVVEPNFDPETTHCFCFGFVCANAIS